MTDAELDAIRARADAATPGPWRYVRDTDGYRDAGFFVEPAGDIDFDWDDYIVAACDTRTIVEEEGIDWEARGLPGNPGFGVMKLNDADFIAHAREDIPALVAEIDRLRAENDQVRAMLKQLEWIPRRESWFLTYDRLRYCHICGGFVAQGHAPDCKLAALLRVEEACFAVIDTRAAS